jgi:AcrR family transcriptional regulator
VGDAAHSEETQLARKDPSVPLRRPAAERAIRPQAKTAERSRAILEAAMSVFGANGYNKGTLSEVAEQVGMTHAGVLHHFGSKEGLLIALLQYRDGEAVAGVGARNQVEGPPFLAHLMQTVEENTRRPGGVQTYAVLSGESVTDGHPAQDYFRDRYDTLRDKLAGVLDEVTGGRAEPSELRDSASALIAVMDGMQLQWLLEPGSVDMPRILGLVLDDLVERLATGAKAPSALLAPGVTV